MERRGGREREGKGGEGEGEMDEPLAINFERNLEGSSEMLRYDIGDSERTRRRIPCLREEPSWESRQVRGCSSPRPSTFLSACEKRVNTVARELGREGEGRRTGRSGAYRGVENRSEEFRRKAKGRAEEHGFAVGFR